MSKVVELRVKHPLVGTWYHPDGDSTAEFTVSPAATGFAVSGVDTQDGERFEISEVSWDGEVLGFTSYMPSTSWRTRHRLRVLDDHSVEHDCTTTEVWLKRQGTP